MEKCKNCGDTMTRIRGSIKVNGETRETFIDRYLCTTCHARKPGPLAQTKA